MRPPQEIAGLVEIRRRSCPGVFCAAVRRSARVAGCHIAEQRCSKIVTSVTVRLGAVGYPRQIENEKSSMSRGPGRLERAILDQIESDKAPDRYGQSGVVLISSWDLAYIYQPPSSVDPSASWHPKNATPAQRKAVIRAMHSFVRKFPQYAIGGGKGRGRQIIYEPGDPLSATLLRLENLGKRVFPYVTLATY